MSCGFSALLALRILNDLLASEIVSGKVKISKRNLPVPGMWLANPHSILRGGFSLSRAKAVFIPPAELVVVARSSYPRETERPRRGTPCCTYRYRMWILAGCARRGAPCFFTMLHRFPHEASGIRHQHGSGSDAAHPGIVPIFCAGMPYKHARKQCHFPACFPILSA